MRKTVFLLLLIISSLASSAQPDENKMLRAFPITDYITPISDSVKLVQVHLPGNPVIKEKQLGMLKAVYKTSKEDVVEKGAGRCNLIKGDYYYFTIDISKSQLQPEGGDLLYMNLPKPASYSNQLVKLAAHYISLTDVYESPFYDRYAIFNSWTQKEEKAALDSMVKDIIFTGDYFNRNSPENDVLITSGPYKDKKAFSVMMKSNVKMLADFLDYIIARPALYAGRSWKISEIFATWLTSGAPTVVKE